ncbi:unnamed protein product [Symbiodinium sp. CCMP2592]|nr:unnamed protein product [Symbiodinium sp. CCMP2592]CAE7537174.1 unnamed protein product [Symbiodinium sp. CCMP2592]
MAILLYFLEAECGVLLRRMLTPAEELLLLQVGRSSNMRRLAWARAVLADVARLRRVLEPLRTMRLRFPGFDLPVSIRYTKGWAPPNPSDPLETLGPVEDLLCWLDDFGLGGFSPAEAVLVMNAWPIETRDAGAALSDLLEESDSHFFYSARPAAFRTQFRPTLVNVVVFFTYRGLNTVLQMQDVVNDGGSESEATPTTACHATDEKEDRLCVPGDDCRSKSEVDSIHLRLFSSTVHVAAASASIKKARAGSTRIPSPSMSGIDYSKWDLLQSSSDEEDFGNPIPPQSPRQPITTGPWAVADPWCKCNPLVRREVLREEKILHRFVQEHPCPSEKSLRRWLRSMSGTERIVPGELTFAWVMKDMGWNFEHLAWFHYPSFRKLWQAAALQTAEAFTVQRDAGSTLYQRGGKECMQFNFYALQHAMCGEHFHTDAPLPVYSYAKRLEHVWDGIGSWQA